MDTFGEWLRGQRSARKLTREEFAERVGCSASALRKIENGERRPSVQIAQLIANCLDIPWEEHSTFVRVARGELSTEQFLPKSKLIATPSIPSPKTNLPVFPTPLIGREREVEQLSQLLRDPLCRLLTLVGPGGIGKTRLAIETASRMEKLFPDGIFFVPLDSATSTRLIVPAVADSLGFTFQSANPSNPKTQLFGYLKEKRILLLPDNLEQLLTEPGIEFMAELLASVPHMKLLATSRECLGLHGEWVFDVQGLSVPEATSTEETLQDTSVELFLQRARRAHVGFNATPEDFPAILRICQLVDGMPLGIELAAAWVRTLSCDEIGREIKGGMDFLSLSARDMPARHRSMRAVFDHSWKLLTEEEQRVLMRLSFFRGGFKREAAEQVAEATLPVLSALVTKSLIRRSGAGHYDLHELIRQFAGEQLARKPDEQIEAQVRHGRYYLTYFAQADGRLRSAAQREALSELTTEMDNFRAAWDWAITYGEFALIEQTLRTLFRLYDTRGWFQEGVEMLDRTVQALETVQIHSPPQRTHAIALGHLLATRAWFGYRLANYEQAQRILERSFEILRPLNEARVLVESLTYLGRVQEMTGHYAEALESYSEALELATAIEDRWFKAVCGILQTALMGLTDTLLKPEITYERLRSIVAESRLIGDPRIMALGLDFLSRSALRLGRFDEARAALEETVELNRSIGFGWGLGTAYRALGKVAQAQGEHQKAIAMFRKSKDTFTELGGSWFVARALAEMGESMLALGDEVEAGRVWREALRIATDIHGTPVALQALAGLANLLAKQGDQEHALALLLLVLNHPASLQVTKDRAHVLRQELEAQLTSTQIEAIQAHVEEKTFETVVGEFLE